MKKLSFPDMKISEMQLLPTNNVLKVVVEGGWLDVNGGERLGKGTLLFSDWNSMTVNRFDPITELWSQNSKHDLEYLKDICEFKFCDSVVSLCGFGQNSGCWLEWKISDANMQADFD
ncbi:MAG: hypothetical protein Q8K75_06680 [Chlamydiales bacterium]|nr:hypothetical protein [Chlamydiales bacterium]